MKIAILDLGTNTFHLLIVKAGRDHSFKKIFKSKIAVKLGEGAIHENRIGEVPFKRGIAALVHYQDIIAEHKPEKIFAFATSAIRSATNGDDFVKAARLKAGINIQVIPGSKEAELIYFGVRQCVKMGEQKQLIMDIGGGSTEFIIANEKKIFWKQSFNIGASRLLEMFKPSDPVTPTEIVKLEEFLVRILTPLDAAIKKYPVHSLIGSSGSFDTLAEMMGWKFHKKNVLKNVKTLQFNMNEYDELHRLLLKSTTAQRMKMKGLVRMRADMIVISSICTSFILNRYRLSEMILSKFALKEGALWQIAGGENKL